MNLVWIESCFVVFINQTLSLFRDKIKLDRCFYLYYKLLLQSLFEGVHVGMGVDASRYYFTHKPDPVGQILISWNFCAHKLLLF